MEDWINLVAPKQYLEVSTDLYIVPNSGFKRVYFKNLIIILCGIFWKYLFIWLLRVFVSDLACFMWDLSLWHLDFLFLLWSSALYWGTPVLEHAGSVVVAHRPSWPMACGNISFPSRDRTLMPCIARWILNYWTDHQGNPNVKLFLLFIYLF